MSNPYFVATLSSNEVYRNRDRTRCVTDDLDSIEDRIQSTLRPTSLMRLRLPRRRRSSPSAELDGCCSGLTTIPALLRQTMPISSQR